MPIVNRVLAFLRLLGVVKDDDDITRIRSAIEEYADGFGSSEAMVQLNHMLLAIQRGAAR